VSMRNVLFALTIIAKDADYSMKISVWNVKLASSSNTQIDTLPLIIALIATTIPLLKQRLVFIVSTAMSVLLIVKNVSTSMNVASARLAFS
jgi:hypothetical protein